MGEANLGRLGQLIPLLGCVRAMPAHFENDEKCDGSKIWASVHTMPEQFENGQKFAGKKLVARLWCLLSKPKS